MKQLLSLLLCAFLGTHFTYAQMPGNQKNNSSNGAVQNDFRLAALLSKTTRVPATFTQNLQTGIADTAYILQNNNVATLELPDFSGKVAGAKVALHWTITANETGQYFEVQRSSKGSPYQHIGTLQTTDATGEAAYTFTDEAPAQTTFYRLKLTNKDGTVSLSNAISVKSTDSSTGIVLLKNPVQKKLRFTVPGATQINGIVIYNMAGVAVYTDKTEQENNTVTLPLKASLPHGIYILQVTTGSSNKTAAFVKQ